jgi:hypothetical protein
VLLSQLTASVRRLALVGLAKNTGKTETLAALLRELHEEGRRVGVTSVGRDGEERDVIDSRIEKPRVRLSAGSLVATTDGLLSASGIPHTLLESTAVRTPLGRVLIASLREPGIIEVAGPSAAEDVRAVSDAMLGHGAEQVLIDGAIDRRAASSPKVTDGLVIATGAVLGAEPAEVVSRTRDAIELVRLPLLEDLRLRELAGGAGDGGGSDGSGRPSLLVSADYEPVELSPRFVLTGEGEQIATLLDGNPAARWLIVHGALPESFLAGLLRARRGREGELGVIVDDSTHVFLTERGPLWYARQGLQLHALAPIALEALTVNPVAPQSHSFDSARLRALLSESLTDLPIFDVKHPDYGATQGRKAPDRAGT